ncbi:MAG: NAD(P)-binding domain-containing protein [Crocosphaera sp.]|nr:NAD(P)-binding domain-containing protein [Crocosphaera sp.]
MKIAIFGAGGVGGTLGTVWAAKGHEIFFGVPNPTSEKTQTLLSKIDSNVQAGTVAQASGFSDVIVLATPWAATESAIKAAGNLSGKTILDCTNPLKPDFSALTMGFTTSGGEQVAQWAVGANVVKTLNQTGYENMSDPVYGGQATVMFACGDNENAKATALTLVSDLGFDAVDAGGLEMARLLEPLAMLWISLAYRQGLGRNTAFALMRR